MSRPTSTTTADSGEPAFKRRRVALACRSCRNRKVRCDGAKPACKLCIELGFDCVYEPPVKAGGSGVHISHDGYEERLRAVEQTLQMLVRERDLCAAPFARASGQWRPVARSSEDVTVLDVSPDERGGDAPVDGLVTVADLARSEGAFYGPSSNVAFIRELSNAIKIRSRHVRSAPGALGSGEHSILSRATSPQPPGRATSAIPSAMVDVRILPPEALVITLTELFFNDTGLLFPFVCKQHVLQAYHDARRTGFRGVARPLLCLLNVIFAFATYISVHPESASGSDADAAEVFFQRARKLAHDHELQSPSLMLVQALLLMCLYRQGSQVVDDPWQLHCLAFRSAMQLGLHSPSFSEGLTALDAEIRKRTWFGCIGIDRILAMSYGRPPAIPESYVPLDLPTDCDLEMLAGTHVSTSGHGARGARTASLFICTTSLYGILYDVIAQVYGFNLELRQGMNLADMLPIVDALETKLSSFERSVPPRMKIRPWENGADTDAEFRRLSAILRQRTLNVRLLLHRPILACLLASESARDRSIPGTPEDHLVGEMAQGSAVYCEAAAVEIIDIAYILRSRPSMLGAFWFASYYTFNAALAIFACFMLDLDAHSHRCSHAAGARGDSSEHARFVESVRDKGGALRRALVVVESLGGNTRSARRIRKTLIKVVQTAQMLCSDDAEVNRALAEALEMPHAGERDEEERRGGEPGTNVAAGHLHDAAAETAAPAPLDLVGFHVGPMWNDVNFDDIFGDMMTFDEVGFTAL